MSKLCKKCNASVANAAKTCPKCGASFVEEDVIDASAPLTAENVTGMSNVDTKAQIKGGVDKVKGAANDFVEKVKSDEKTRNNIIIVVAAVILLIVLKLVLFPSPMSVLKTYCKGMKNFDAKKIVSTMNKDMVKAAEEDLEDLNSDYDDLEDMLDDMFEELKDNDYKIKSYEIDSDYDKYDKDDLEDLADAIEDNYDIKASKVKAARKYTVKMKVKNDDETKTEKSKIVLVKIGMKWYIYSPGSLG